MMKWFESENKITYLIALLALLIIARMVWILC
jgi:hypothetical protein